MECDDFSLGCCCPGLALSWIEEVLQGRVRGVEERDVLAALRWLRRRASGAVYSTRLARARGWSEERAERALSASRDTGYLEIIPYGIRFSGLREHRLAGEPPAIHLATSEAMEGEP